MTANDSLNPIESGKRFEQRLQSPYHVHGLNPIESGKRFEPMYLKIKN